MTKNNKFFELLSLVMHYYATRGEITVERILFTFYLVDWKSSLIGDKQISTVNWRKFNESFLSSLSESLELAKIGKKVYKFEKEIKNITPKEKAIVDEILSITSKLTEIEMMKLVMSTFPMTSSKEDVDLDLSNKAQEYKDEYDYIQ